MGIAQSATALPLQALVLSAFNAFARESHHIYGKINRMRPSEAFAQHRDIIRQIVLESGMTNPRLFGSALHGDDIEGSDLDILIDAPPRTSLFDVINLKLALEDEVGITIDLRTPGDLHPKFRDHVVAEASPV